MQHGHDTSPVLNGTCMWWKLSGITCFSKTKKNGQLLNFEISHHVVAYRTNRATLCWQNCIQCLAWDLILSDSKAFTMKNSYGRWRAWVRTVEVNLSGEEGYIMIGTLWCPPHVYCGTWWSSRLTGEQDGIELNGPPPWLFANQPLTHAKREWAWVGLIMCTGAVVQWAELTFFFSIDPV